MSFKGGTGSKVHPNKTNIAQRPRSTATSQTLATRITSSTAGAPPSSARSLVPGIWPYAKNALQKGVMLVGGLRHAKDILPSVPHPVSYALTWYETPLAYHCHPLSGKWPYLLGGFGPFITLKPLRRRMIPLIPCDPYNPP